MTLIKEKQNKPKIQSVNRCIKPVHFCIYKVRDHLCTCYILSHSQFISSPSGGYERGITSPFLEQETQIYTQGPSHRCGTPRQVVCENSCVLDHQVLWGMTLVLLSLEATVFQVLLKVSGQLELYYTTLWSLPWQHITLFLNTELSLFYLRTLDSLRSHYRLLRGSGVWNGPCKI